MNQPASATHLQLILREQDELVRLETRKYELGVAQTKAKVVLAGAQAALDDVTSELDYTHARYSCVTDRLHVLRQSFRRDMMKRLPDEILLYIFKTFVALPEAFLCSTQETVCYSDAHAKAPFTVAAVCARWRAIALRQPSLWTYISAPSPASSTDMVSPSHLSRIHLLLERSASAPLDILLNLRRGYSDSDWMQREELKNVLDALTRCATRWRTFELYLGEQFGADELLVQCRGPLPVLERFMVKLTHEVRRGTRGNLFPLAPRLRVLHVQANCPFGFDFATKAVTPSLTSVTLRVPTISLSKLLGFLLAMAPTVESLTVPLYPDSLANLDTSPVAIVFPQLKHLQVNEPWFELPGQHVQLWVMPRLQHLHWLHFDGAATWLDSMSDRIVELTIYVGDALPDLDMLIRLRNVQRVTFTNPQPSFVTDLHWEPLVLEEEFFSDPARWLDPQTWPELRSITFLDDVMPYPDSFLTFLRWRTTDIQSVYPTSPRPSRIEEVKFVPLDEAIDLDNEWFVAEVNRLLCM